MGGPPQPPTGLPFPRPLYIVFQNESLKKEQNLTPFFIEQKLSITIYLSTSILKMFPTVFG